jgi:hypothetical protein
MQVRRWDWLAGLSDLGDPEAPGGEMKSGLQKA